MTRFDVRHYDSIGSTNDEALRLAREGAAHGTVVSAREQIAGRGRQGRHWHSAAGNIYVSLVLRPDVPPTQAATLSFVTALAVADTVDACLPPGLRAELKWPNDVLVGGAKIAGILLEHADTAVVVGIGLNVEHSPSGTPYPVTSLRQLATPTPSLPRFAGEGAAASPPERGVEHALAILLDCFGRRLAEWGESRFAATRVAWLMRAHPPGTPLRVNLGTDAICGTFADLADDGALMIDTPQGPRRIVAGDVAARPIG